MAKHDEIPRSANGDQPEPETEPAPPPESPPAEDTELDLDWFEKGLSVDDAEPLDWLEEGDVVTRG